MARTRRRSRGGVSMRRVHMSDTCRTCGQPLPERDGFAEAVDEYYSAILFWFTVGNDRALRHVECDRAQARLSAAAAHLRNLYEARGSEDADRLDWLLANAQCWINETAHGGDRLQSREDVD